MRAVRLTSLLTVAAVMAALVPAGCGAGEDRPGTSASLILDFAPNAVHAGIYTAVARGYDEAEGVTLRVRAPTASTDSVRLLAAGRTQFAILDIHDLALARERGRDLVGVMALVQRPLAAVIAEPSVRRPRALAGRRAGVSGLPSDRAVLRSVVEGDGGDPRRVREITIGFGAVRSLLSGRVDAATAFWNVEGLALRRARPGIREFRVDAFGAPSYPELVLTATRATLRDEPATVRATAAALARGYRFTLTDPEGSAGDMLRSVRGLDRDGLLAQLDAVSPAFLPPDGVYGELDPGRLRAWAAWERRFGIVERTPDVRTMFDGRYVPRDAEPG